MNFRNSRRIRGSATIDLTPVLDVVFILLIFFLITSTFAQQTNSGIDVELPRASTTPNPQESESIIIAISEEGQFIRDGQAVSPEELATQLSALHTERPQATVIVQADVHTQHGKVVEAMDLARKAGYERLAIATEGEP